MRVVPTLFTEARGRGGSEVWRRSLPGVDPLSPDRIGGDVLRKTMGRGNRGPKSRNPSWVGAQPDRTWLGGETSSGVFCTYPPSFDQTLNWSLLGKAGYGDEGGLGLVAPRPSARRLLRIL